MMNRRAFLSRIGMVVAVAPVVAAVSKVIPETPVEPAMYGFIRNDSEHGVMWIKPHPQLDGWSYEKAEAEAIFRMRESIEKSIWELTRKDSGIT